MRLHGHLHQAGGCLPEQRFRTVVAGVETLDLPQQRHRVLFGGLGHEPLPKQRLRLLQIGGDHRQRGHPLLQPRLDFQ